MSQKKTKQTESLDCLIFLPSLSSGGTEKVAVLLSGVLVKYMKVGLVTFSCEKDDFFPIDGGVVRFALDSLSESQSFYEVLRNNLLRV